MMSPRRNVVAMAGVLIGAPAIFCAVASAARGEYPSGGQLGVWRIAMLYLGHFTFGPPESGAAIGNTDLGGGWFTCLCEAESADEAVNKFQNLIVSLDDSFETFEDVGNVYFETAVEVRKLPEEGVLARFEHSTADGMGRISTALPGVPSEACMAFDWNKEEIDVEAEEGYTPEPFVYEKRAEGGSP